MRLKKITLRHFRNVGFATLEFSGRQQFLLGANGQGKTNLLEAAGFLTALRSFRATDNKLLIGHGQQVAAIAAELEHERQGDTNVTIKLRRDGKELWCDQARVTRLADHLGTFPTVVFSSQDLLLVRGSLRALTVRRAPGQAPPRIDLLGAALLLAGLTAFLVPITRIGQGVAWAGWKPEGGAGEWRLGVGARRPLRAGTSTALVELAWSRSFNVSGR